jgi:hypothetical protein
MLVNFFRGYYRFFFLGVIKVFFENQGLLKMEERKMKKLKRNLKIRA